MKTKNGRIVLAKTIKVWDEYNPSNYMIITTGTTKSRKQLESELKEAKAELIEMYHKHEKEKTDGMLRDLKAKLNMIRRY